MWDKVDGRIESNYTLWVTLRGTTFFVMNVEKNTLRKGLLYLASVYIQEKDDLHVSLVSLEQHLHGRQSKSFMLVKMWEKIYLKCDT